MFIGLSASSRQFQRLSDARRASVGQNSVSARVEVLLRPRHILAAFFAGSAVATGRFAARNADELISFSGRNIYFRCQNNYSGSAGKRDQKHQGLNVSNHVLDTSGNRNCKPF